MNNALLEYANKQGTRLGLNLGLGLPPQLYCVLDRVLWPNAMISTTLDYTAPRAVRRMEALRQLNTQKIAGSLIVTLQDDNIGSLPQVMTSSLDILLHEAAACGWEGFSTRYWPSGDLDPVAAFLSRASWDRSATPAAVYDDHFGHLYGKTVAPTLSRVMRLLEDATTLTCFDGPGMLFPVEEGMCHHFTGKAKRVDILVAHITALYRQCENMLAQCEGDVDHVVGKEYLAYWHSRLRFSIEAMSQCVIAGKAAAALKDWKESLQDSMGPKQSEALRDIELEFEKAIEAGERAVHAMASCVRDDSDRASLAAYYHFLIREPRQTIAKELARVKLPKVPS